MKTGSIIKKIIIFIIPLIAVFIIVEGISFTDKGDAMIGKLFLSEQYRHVGSRQISPAINIAQTESEHTKIVLGDSMCNYVFMGFADQNDDYLLLGTNMAVTVDGQYILARMFLETHPEATDVYLVLLPVSFAGGYDSPQSYSYLIEPFGRAGKLSYLSDDTIQGMKDLYGSAFLSRNVIRFLDGSSINNKIYLYYLQNNKLKTDNEDVISDEALYYLKDLYEICRERNVSLHLLPPPVCDSTENAERISGLKEAVSGSDISFLFAGYFDSISLYPEYMFSDGHHVYGEYATPEAYKGYIDDLLSRSGELQGLIYNVE